MGTQTCETYYTQIYLMQGHISYTQNISHLTLYQSHIQHAHILFIQNIYHIAHIQIPKNTDILLPYIQHILFTYIVYAIYLTDINTNHICDTCVLLSYIVGKPHTSHKP